MARWTEGQWPDAITTGEIEYTHVQVNCGMGEWYALRDSSHGIPVFGSVRAYAEAPGYEVRVFNYPGQTEHLAAALVKRWNAHADLVEALKEGRRAIGDHFAPDDCYATGPMTGDPIRDLVQCPACSFIAMYDRAVAKAAP